MFKFVFITGNTGKLMEFQRYFGEPVEHMPLDLHEIQSLDSAEIVRDKAARAHEQLKKPVLVEDVSFVFTALGKLPGPFIKWIEKELDEEGLCRLVDGKDRSCVATVCYGLHDGRQIHLVEGSMSGTVAEHPRGENSFGWGSIFIPHGMDKTYAELSNEEQAAISMRKKALAKLRELVKSLES